MRQVTWDATSDLCTDTVRHKYPVARPDVRTDICVHTSASPSAADKNKRNIAIDLVLLEMGHIRVRNLVEKQ